MKETPGYIVNSGPAQVPRDSVRRRRREETAAAIVDGLEIQISS